LGKRGGEKEEGRRKRKRKRGKREEEEKKKNWEGGGFSVLADSQQPSHSLPTPPKKEWLQTIDRGRYLLPQM
jgi:hypothetical protein